MTSKQRRPIPADVAADVLTASRRRCCACFGLRQDSAEKRGQLAHLDHDPSNNALENLAFLCLEHHDQYDSRTSQSKGMTIEELQRYRTELFVFLDQAISPPDSEIVTLLMEALDRPAYRTPFRSESDLPRFREAIAETIETLNTGYTPQGALIASKFQIRDPSLRQAADDIVEALVWLRSTFEHFLRNGSIKPCGCNTPDCPTFMLSDEAAGEMDSQRLDLLRRASELSGNGPAGFYKFAP